MDFFERQDQARGRTTLLVVYFVLTVLCIIAALYVVSVLIFTKSLSRPASEFQWWQPTIFLWVSVVTVSVIGIASLIKIQALSGGGGVVAESLGGRKVEPFTQDPSHRRLLNVVEEMAIASGTPVPEVYVLPEQSINAFAAGFSPHDAAVAVTQGCLDNLSRDELQGVIAHEFSHILNGDMRLNIRLMGVIFGILVLAVIGGGILRSLRFVSLSGNRRNSKDGGGGGGFIIAILALAVSLYLIGSIGVFFGRLIQSAVSRQREFLADAAAVQFTRNPGGLSGALKRIGGIGLGSRLESPHAQEAAHLFFASGIRSYLGGIFATHPPLDERIRAIEPDWDGHLINSPYAWPDSALTPPKLPPHIKPSPITAKATASPLEMVFAVGTLSASALEQATATRRSLEEEFGLALRGPLEARSLIYALVLDSDETRRSQQLGYLQTEAGDEVAQTVRELYPRIVRRDRGDTLAMIELALPALSQMEKSFSERFLQRLNRLVEMDGKVTVFEFVVTRLVRRHLALRNTPKAHPSTYIWSASALAAPFSQLLSAVIYLSTQNPAEAERLFTEAARTSPVFKDHLKLVPAAQLNFAGLDQSLDKLARGAYGLRKQVLTVCAHAVSADGKTSADEAELFRAIAVSLDCPMPPPA